MSEKFPTYEQLKAERDLHRMEANTLRAERDKFKKLWNEEEQDAQAAWVEAGALRLERDRLRAALEEIDKDTLAKDAELALWVIRSKARQALAGGEK